MLEMTSDIVAAINQPDPNVFVTAARRQMAGNTLRRDAVQLVLSGRTTIDEAMRISTQIDE